MTELAGDWDQRAEIEEDVEALGVEIYNSAVHRTLSAIIAAIEEGSSVTDIKSLCERGIAALAKAEED